MVGTTATGVVCALVAGGIWWAIGRRPTAAQVEERRRKRLAMSGRIVDGSLIDADPQDATAQKIIYTYKIAGVTYECSQDVSMLGDLVRNLRLDYPVQVRYNRANPADSIVVAENWNGLWKRMEGSSRQLETVHNS
jgi:hypothetical protein